MPKDGQRLSFEKCTQCRRDKQKCEPIDRQWPQQKCNRCASKGWPCSENVRAGSRRAGAGPEVPEADFQQYVELSLRHSALEMMMWRRPQKVVDAERAEHHSILLSAGRLIQSTESIYIKFITLSLVERVVFSMARMDGCSMDVTGFPAFLETARQVGHWGAASSIGLHILAKEALTPRITVIQSAGQFVDDCSHLSRLIGRTAASRRSDLPSEISIGQIAFAIISHSFISWKSALLVAASLDITPTSDASGCTLLHLIMERLPVRGPVITGQATYTSIDRDSATALERILRVVDIDKQDCHGRTALHITCLRGQVLAAQFLIEKGAKTYLEDLKHIGNMTGRTPIDLALSQGELGLVVELCRKAPPERRACFLTHAANYLREAPLLVAYNLQDFPVIKAMHEIWCTHLVANDSCQDEGLGFLHLAARSGDIQMLRRLLECNLRPFDCLSRSGRTPLSLAAESGSTSAVGALLRCDGVNPDARDNSGRTPLSFAAEKGHLRIVKILLLERGNANTWSVNSESKDDGGRTPLDYATAKSHLAVVQFLRNRNALDDVIEVSGATPGNLLALEASDAPMMDLHKTMGPPPLFGLPSIIENPNYTSIAIRDPEGSRKRKYAGSVMSKSSTATQSTNSQRLRFEIEWPDTGSIKSHSSIGRDYRCCGQQWSNMHDLLEHEESHRGKSEGANGTEARKLDVARLTEEVRRDYITQGVGYWSKS